MAIRHFAKRAHSITESESSDEEQPDYENSKTCAKSGLTDNISDSNEKNDDTKNIEESESNTSSAENSSSEEELLLKPILVKKRPEIRDDTSSNMAKRSLLRAAYLNNMNEKTEFDRKILNPDLTDQSFLSKVMALDDNDGLDSEKDLKNWEFREQLRKNRRREQKLQIQRQLEEQELYKTLQLTNQSHITETKSHTPNKSTTLPFSICSNDRRQSSDAHQHHMRSFKNQTNPRPLAKSLVNMDTASNRYSNQDTEYNYLDED